MKSKKNSSTGAIPAPSSNDSNSATALSSIATLAPPRLYEVRACNLRAALDHIVERASITETNSEAIVHAIKAYAHVNAKGQWEEPLRKIMAVKEEIPEGGVNIVVSPALYDAYKGRQLAEAQAQEKANNKRLEEAKNHPQ